MEDDWRSGIGDSEGLTASQIFLSFNGRITRGIYWISLFGLVVGAVALAIAGFIAIPMLTGSNDAVQWLPLAINLLVIWPTLAISTKRWHDRGKSGWWQLILFVPLLGPLWALLQCGFLKGERRDNRFGPSPY